MAWSSRIRRARDRTTQAGGENGVFSSVALWKLHVIEGLIVYDRLYFDTAENEALCNAG